MKIRFYAPITVLMPVILGTLTSCQPPSSVFGKCLSLVGHNPAKDAAQDFHNREGYLMTDVGPGGAVFIPGYQGKACHFIYGRGGRMLRTNRRPRPSLPSGDVLTPQEITCVNQYHAYGEAYNRAFARLDGRAFDRTCSAMTLEEARRQFGSVDETISDLKR